MPYQWDGTTILQKNTAFEDRRVVVGHPDVAVCTDLREWIVSGGMAEIRRVIETLDVPTAKTPGSFDRRADTVWRWVIEHIEYEHDIQSQRMSDFYQFPPETLALGKGDCEDGAFLLASLLLASGISPYCVRVVFGTIKHSDEHISEDHAWVVYKDESGLWRILDSTVSLPPAEVEAEDSPSGYSWPIADVQSNYRVSKRRPTYRPDLCFNEQHVWAIREIELDVAAYVEAFHRPKSDG